MECESRPRLLPCTGALPVMLLARCTRGASDAADPKMTSPQSVASDTCPLDDDTETSSLQPRRSLLLFTVIFEYAQHVKQRGARGRRRRLQQRVDRSEQLERPHSARRIGSIVEPRRPVWQVLLCRPCPLLCRRLERPSTWRNAANVAATRSPQDGLLFACEREATPACSPHKTNVREAQLGSRPYTRYVAGQGCRPTSRGIRVDVTSS